MDTRIFLVRHGATEATAEDRFSCAVDVPPSDKARWQTERLGDRLKRQGVTAVYSSPLSRALDTARIIAGCCGLEPMAR